MEIFVSLTSGEVDGSMESSGVPGGGGLLNEWVGRFLHSSYLQQVTDRKSVRMSLPTSLRLRFESFGGALA